MAKTEPTVKLVHNASEPDMEFIKEGFVTFSAVQANTVLRECPFDGQRGVSKDHVAVLADMMKNDKWEDKDKLDFAVLHGSPILINGYHRMHAQVASGKSVKWTVVMHPCASMDDVRGLYYRFDTNTRMRSAPQILAATNFAENVDLTKQMAEAVFRSVPLIANDFSASKKSRDLLTAKVIDRRLEYARMYVRAAEQYQTALEGAQWGFKSKFHSAGVCAVALVTFRYQPVTAMEFWHGVASNDGLRKGDPRQTLFNYFAANSVAKSSGRSGGNVVNAFAPSIAWNAFFEGRPLQIIKHYEGREITIQGTPWEKD